MEPSTEADTGDAPSTVTRPRPETDTTGFEVTEEGVRWVCVTCGTPNNLEATECAVCGMAFAEILRPKPARPEGDPGKAALYSLLFPGAGHGYLRMWGQAIARAVLSVWVLLVTLVGILDQDVPGSLAMATIFGVAALALWVITAHDAFQEASHDESKVLLRGRRFLYVVLGLMALLFVVMLVALMSARGRVEETALSIPAWRSTSSPIFTELPTI